MSKIISVYHNDAETLQNICRVDFTGRRVGGIGRTEEGYLTGVAPIAKIGILTYFLTDGTTRRELVNDNTLFNADSMATLQMKPITDTHPPERALDSKTVKRRKVGFTGENIKKDGEFLMVPITVTDEDAVNSVDGGRQELSPGYRCDLLLEPGEFNGQNYDGVQLNRRYNHVAICDRARGGSDLKLHLDQVDHLDGFEVNDMVLEDKKGDALFNEDEIKAIKLLLKGKELNMPQFNVDGINYEAAQEVINFATKEATRADAAESKVAGLTTTNTDLQTKVDTLEGERDGLKTKVDELEKVDHSEAIVVGITERLDVLDAVDAVIPEEKRKEMKIDDLSNMDLKKAVIVSKSPDVNLDDRTDDYLNARFDSIVEGIKFDPDATGRSRKKAAQRNDTDPDPVEKARKDSEDRMQNSYKDLGGRVKAEAA